MRGIEALETPPSSIITFTYLQRKKPDNQDDKMMLILRSHQTTNVSDTPSTELPFCGKLKTFAIQVLQKQNTVNVKVSHE